MPPETLRRWADGAEVVLAADGGADRLLEAGLRPTRIVGDLDSISRRARDIGVPIDEVEDQNFTDCDKLLAFAASQGIAEITLASIEGDALDHVLASLSSTLKADLAVRLALRTGIAWVLRVGARLAPASARIRTSEGRRVSLMPLLPCAGVDLEGVRWPLQKAELAPDGLVSVSNRAAGEVVHASIESGAALLVVEYPLEEVPIW
jgi:thiamine pyrophosphokinase